ncbi:hypothetical protein I79_005148 [Cricetulus griseus]|uniref:Uncharacterized protein n=1 Tax=Cricetulus griseus TaxID=10029 RepID=G3H4E7_CRIGR|nr:hypothetical protein I79_005148 [Cricetulus griseus]
MKMWPAYLVLLLLHHQGAVSSMSSRICGHTRKFLLLSTLQPHPGGSPEWPVTLLEPHQDARETLLSSLEGRHLSGATSPGSPAEEDYICRATR